MSNRAPVRSWNQAVEVLRLDRLEHEPARQPSKGRGEFQQPRAPDHEGEVRGLPGTSSPARHLLAASRRSRSLAISLRPDSSQTAARPQPDMAEKAFEVVSVGMIYLALRLTQAILVN